jgi:general secretion pathway protein G
MKTPPHRNPAAPRLRGAQAAFTLVELLTVIAIIGILAAIIIPTVGKVRKTARDAQCKASLRALGAAAQLFVNDNRDRLPVAKGDRETGPGFWYVQLAAYLSRTVAESTKTAHEKENMIIGALAICPAGFIDRSTYVKGMGISYGWNYGAGVAIHDGVPYSSIPTPSRTIFLAERWGKNTANSWDSDSLVWPPWSSNIPLDTDITQAGANPSTLRLSHGGRGNYLFFDGHVGSYRPEETYTGSGSASESPNLWRGI